MIEPKIKLTNKDYHLLQSVSHSSLECFRRSKREYRARYIDRTIEWKQTPAMLLGSVVHCMLLEPNKVCDQYAIMPKPDLRTKVGKLLNVMLTEPDRVLELYSIMPPCNRRTKVGRALYDEYVAEADGKEVVDQDTYDQATAIISRANGREIIDQDTYDQADAIALSVMENTTARMLLETVAEREQPMYWTCSKTGIECRSKPDLLATVGSFYLLDIKTCQDATPQGFASACAKYGYGRQAAWYQWGCEMYGMARPQFVFVAVSTNEPYEVGIYDLSEHDLARSRMQNELDLNEFAKCEASGDWAGQHERNKVTLQLPRWADYEDQYQTY